MLNKFLTYIRENKLADKNDRILMAVSGGIDSMVMADLLLKAGFKTAVAHCNFCLRGNEADKDEELVRKYAGSNKIEFFLKRFETKKYAVQNRLSIQMAARELRYSWFDELMNEKGFNITAVGHNLNDNIETMLINLTRGTGLTGLTGIKPMSGKIIRPLLFASRNDIEDYCKENKIHYREDMSNAETVYTRNKIRHKVIPELKKINPLAEYALNETIKRLSETKDISDRFIAEISNRIITHSDKIKIINLALLQPCLNNKTLVYELLKPFGITDTTLKNLYSIIKGRSGRQIYTMSHMILKNRNELIISPLKASPKVYIEIPDISTLKQLPFIDSADIIRIPDNYFIPVEKSTACLDSSAVSFPLVIRTWQPGDYFYPLGMKQKKKLSDYFIDSKYSVHEKGEKLIMESSGEIVWIIGDRIDNRYRITSTTKKALIIRALGL